MLQEFRERDYKIHENGSCTVNSTSKGVSFENATISDDVILHRHYVPSWIPGFL